MQSLRRFLVRFEARHLIYGALALATVSNQLSIAGLAAAPEVAPPAAQHSGSAAAVCPAAQSDSCSASADPAVDAPPQLSLPAGASQCPSSGPGAACSTVGVAPQAGLASLPDGKEACGASVGQPLLDTPAACSDAVLPVIVGGGLGTSAASPLVSPSVPVASLQISGSAQRLQLSASPTTLRPGQSSLLTATANAGLSGINSAIEIFDQTTGSLLAACAQASQCLVAYQAPAGAHTFAAFLTPPTQSIPQTNQVVISNPVTVGWLDSHVSASDVIVGAGRQVTVTATSTLDVATSGRWLEIYDLTAKAKLTYCSRGTACTVTVKQPAGGVHEIVGYVTGQPEAVSAPIYVTWLGVSLAANTTSQKTAGYVYLTATANADLTNTPWAMAIYDDQGRLVDHACKTGATCSVHTWVNGGGTVPTYTAAIGALPPTGSPGAPGAVLPKPGGTQLVDVQAHTAAVRPARTLWGVDSCKSFTADSAGASGLYPQVLATYGKPDFWGRYLTDTVCPGISATETAAAAHNHMGILPIYNDYDCSAVVGYAAGKGYADAATAAAKGLGIPTGRALAIDIEPPGAACPGAAGVDSGFIEGWYDGVMAARYVPAYYGNGTAGSEFASAWCTIVALVPEVARDSYLWSFEPSLLGSYTKATAPDFAPQQTGCAGNMAAWQYELSAGSDPDVDTDEAMSGLPLWYPS